MTSETRPNLNDPALMDPAIIADPYPRYQQLREQDPVHWNEGINCWTLTRYADVLSALRDQRLSSDQMTAFTERLPEAAARRFNR